MRDITRRLAVAGAALAVAAPAAAQRFTPPAPEAAARLEETAADVTMVQVAIIGVLVLLVAFFFIRRAMGK